MRLLQSPNADMKALSIVAPIVKGGTGADNSTEAVQNLGGLNAASLGQANGVAKLNAQGKLDLTVFPTMVMVGPTLNGPTVVYTGQTVQFIITNYDINTTYNISASVGTLTRSGDTLSYTAPGTTGTLTLTVNNKVASVAIQNTSPIAPSITSPVTGSTGLSASVAFTATSFAMNNGTDTHAASDWQIATDSGFTNVVSSTTNDTTNKTSWTGSGLSANTTYYARVRYKGTTYGYGAWSTSISFTTKTSFNATSEEAILTASNKAIFDGLGNSVAITADGTRVAISASQATRTASNCGSVYVFTRSGSTWTQEAELSASNKAANDNLGLDVDIDNLGTRIIAGTPNADRSSMTLSGVVYIFSRSGTTWTQEAELSLSIPSTGDRFGSSVAISSDGTRVIIGCPYKNHAGGTNGQGDGYIYIRSGTTWTQEVNVFSLLAPTDYVDNSRIGTSVSITSDGSRVALGALYGQISGVNTGSVYVFSRSGSTWIKEQIFGFGIGADNFGQSVKINADGTRLVVGATGGNGNVYVYSRSGTTWSKEATLTYSLPAGYSSLGFGYSVSISDDGGFVIAGAYNTAISSYSNAGCAILFKRIGTTWSQISTFIPSVIESNMNFSYDIDINSDGSRLIIGAGGKTVSGISYCGAGYIFA